MAPRFYNLDPRFRICPIRGLLGWFHLLYDDSSGEAVLIDTGLIGEMPALRRALRSLGLRWGDIKAILLTHGHLDHTGHLALLKNLSGAPVFAHPAEQPHIDGTFPYRGASRLCGAMEAFGRWVLRYQSALIDEALVPGTTLPYGGGLEVVHLPGHTLGHCGFYSRRFDLLFSGDLFASYSFGAHLPPAFLNSCPEHLEASLERVQTLAPRRMVPNHYGKFDGELHRKRFERLVESRNKPAARS